MNTDRKTQKKVSRTARKDGGGTQRHSAPEGVETLLFEVSAQDVALLKDDELRELVARLCQATLLEEGLPTTCVTWGGDQREPDGGIDVRVQLRADDPLPNGSWLRWRSVGFQVKATEMPPAKIKKEMCPNGSLQSAIQELLQEEGAYIIAAHDSVADQRYRGRVDAMRGCTADLLADRRSAHVDYYDSQRLANWVNAYPTVVAWVYAKKRGGVRQGWEPYGQWATSKRMPDGKYPHFLPDEKARFIDPRDRERTFNLIEGIERVREVLRKGIERAGEEDGKPVRLVGLSGVGKTRFVQALFEEDVGSDALDPVLAVYADVGRETIPSPAVVLGRLISSNKPAVLIMDNCAPSLHRELVAELGKAGSKARVSLLTVEYDIREDLPEDTEVFRLEGGSDDLIERIIRTRFSNVTPVDADTIARFSNGNFRVAIALAESVRSKGSLAGLSDSELFDRLFWQRHGEDKELRSAAEVCALVYSFDGKRDDGELRSLACLADMSVQKLRRFVSELEKRGLVQKRGVWRAILPQAIANRLAADALGYVSYESIERQIVAQDPSVIDETRLLRSFSRRLGYLHDSEKAREIVGKWLSPDGLLGADPEHGRWSFYTELLSNVAPVDPEGVLSIIERLISSNKLRFVIEGGLDSGSLWLTGDDLGDGRVRLLVLLRSIAYDAHLFERCLDVLLRFSIVEYDRQGAAGQIIESMFLLGLSGTHAKTSQRLKWLEERLRSDDESVRSLACRCLSKALKSRALSSGYDFDFGARRRDFGWQPTDGDKNDWYVKFIDMSVKIVGEALPVSSDVKNVISERFRDLWAVAIKVEGVKNSLSRAVRSFVDAGQEEGWEEGWSAIRTTIFYDGKNVAEEDQNVLKELEKVARPKGLLSLLQVLLFGNHLGITFSDALDYSEREREAYELAKGFGRELVKSELLYPEAARLVTEGGRHGDPASRYALGKSMSVHASDMSKMWGVLLEGFESWPVKERDKSVLNGYLEGVFDRDVALFNRLLDEAMERPSLVKHVPSFQALAPLDSQGCDRLLALMKCPDVHAMDFYHGWSGQSGRRLADGSYPDGAVAVILKSLLRMKDGVLAAVKILSLYVFQRTSPVERGLFMLACEVSESVLLAMGSGAIELGRTDGLEYDVENVVRYFWGAAVGVDDEDRETRARHIMRRLVDEGESWIVISSDFMKILGAFFDVRPRAALDVLVGDDEGFEADSRRSAFARDELFSDGYVLASGIPEEVLLEWCESGSPGRWLHAANSVCSVVQAAEETGGEGRWQWSSQAVALLNKSPDPCRVAEVLVKHIRPTFWAGNMSENLEERLPLIDQLSKILGAEHADKIDLWRNQLLDEIDDEKKREARAEAARQKEQARFE